MSRRCWGLHKAYTLIRVQTAILKTIDRSSFLSVKRISDLFFLVLMSWNRAKVLKIVLKAQEFFSIMPQNGFCLCSKGFIRGSTNSGVH